jgi:predicted nucleic acid-binding protein
MQTAPAAAATPPATSPPLAVLDTNVVLDLWLFSDPRAAPLREALHAGLLGVLLTAPMLAELAGVLRRPFATAWPVPGATVLAALQALGSLVQTPAGPHPAPRCTDADDQKFIDLAWAWPARWLISRDRAVLKLARPALARGLHIVTPERWAKLNKTTA